MYSLLTGNGIGISRKTIRVIASIHLKRIKVDSVDETCIVEVYILNKRVE